jgi:heavy metal translocating P-type ATPase
MSGVGRWSRRQIRAGTVAAVATIALAVGAGAGARGGHEARDVVWAVGTAVVLVSEVWPTLQTLRRRSLGADVIALLAMGTALGLGEYLAAILVAVMMAGGGALEAWAAARAGRELSLLVARIPRIAHVVGRDGLIREVPVDAVAVADRVVVRTGEILPVDGTLLDVAAFLDESALTGEPLPVTHERGDELRSGIVNAGVPFHVRASRLASQSTYAGVVRLVQNTEARRAPFQRLADRYAGYLLPLTLGLGGVAWVASGDPVRALAVLVVATPCPLILAAPVALVSGVSRAARRGVIVKGAEVIERLSGITTVLFDKTGTLTHGRPAVVAVVAFAPYDEGELLRLAASLDQFSVHALAEAIVHHAEAVGLGLVVPTGATETPGRGISGTVDGRRVIVGQAAWTATQLAERAPPGLADVDHQAGQAQVAVGIDGRLAGYIVMADRTRDDSADVVARLRAAGVAHVWLVTGDAENVAVVVGRTANVDRVFFDQSPEQKLTVVHEATRTGGSVMMVGDGVNDAPALAAADVGIALGAAGATVASQTADAVVMVDRLGRVADVVEIARHTMGIARQSVIVGMVLSAAAMVVAAYGALAPAAGAVLQEGIDLAVILNALRALHGPLHTAPGRRRDRENTDAQSGTALTPVI